MAFKLSFEYSNDQITIPTKQAFLKVLYNVCKIKNKNINFEYYARIHLDGPKLAICETVSNAVFVLSFFFTTKDNFFRTAIDEACDAFNKTMYEFRYTQKLEIFDPTNHQTNHPPQHPFY